MSNWPEDPGPVIQAAAERHLEKVWEAYHLAADAGEDEIDDPASAPFCGCETCVIREVLAGAWPQIEAYFNRRAEAQVPHPRGPHVPAATGPA